jgi:hypothetical protein
VPGRPALTPIAGLLFYAGLIIALTRFKRSEYAFILLWLVTALAPALVTYPAPHFPRTLLAQLPVAALIAIAVVTIGDGARFVIRRAEWSFATVLLLAILVIGQAAWQTWNDYFVIWANLKEVRFQYNAGPAAVARYLDASSDTDPVILAGLFTDDSDPYNFAVMLRRRDLDLRWFDASSALPVPVGARTMRVILYDFTPIDEALRARYLTGASLVEEQNVFSAYRLDANALRADMEHLQIDAPVSFGDVSILGYDVSSRRVAPGGTFIIITHWRVNAPGAPQPVAIFAHLVNASNTLIAQDDRLGYPHHGWRIGDEFAQVHRITVPTQTAPGAYSLKLGIYFRDTGARWPVAGGDSILLGKPISVMEAQ